MKPIYISVLSTVVLSLLQYLIIGPSITDIGSIVLIFSFCMFFIISYMSIQMIREAEYDAKNMTMYSCIISLIMTFLIFLTKAASARQALGDPKTDILPTAVAAFAGTFIICVFIFLILQPILSKDQLHKIDQ